MEHLASIRRWLSNVAYSEIPRSEPSDGFISLPIDILVAITSYLNLNDVLNISQTCWTFKSKFRNDKIWHIIFRKDFPSQYNEKDDLNWLQCYKRCWLRYHSLQGFTINPAWKRINNHYRRSRILMLGLDGAGKTTLLYFLKHGEIYEDLPPTIGYNAESIGSEYENIFDAGGTAKIRCLWRHYYEHTSCIIWVLDSSDNDRLEEVKQELFDTLSNDHCRDIKLLIFANQVSHKNMPVSPEELMDILDLKSIRQPWYIQPCVVNQYLTIAQEQAIVNGLNWLLDKDYVDLDAIRRGKRRYYTSSKKDVCMAILCCRLNDLLFAKLD